MKRSGFLRLAGIGLIGALISPTLFTKDESNILDDIDLRDMLSRGEEIKNKDFELRRSIDLAEYPNANIHHNEFTIIGKQFAFNIPYTFRGNLSYNIIISKKRFLF